MLVSADQAIAIGSKWAAAWSQTDPAVWTAIYTPDATYTDYAFNVRRKTHAGMEKHFNMWRTANPDFECKVLSAWPGVELSDGRVKYSVRTSNKGTFTNTVPPRLIASGKQFDFYAVIDIVVREDGLIEAIEEWYCRQFDSTVIEG